jgi:general secretion pathway protein G
MTDPDRASICRALPRKKATNAESGMTFLELIMVCAILLILASAALPLARITAKRQQEQELRIDLREMRNAIDAYKDAADRNLFQVEADTDGYPPDLDTLVQGVDITKTGAPAGGTPIGSAASSQTGAAPTSAGFSAGTPSAGAPGQSDQPNSASESVTMHVRFLRRIPVDPMTGKAEWGMRSVQDDSDAGAWGGQDVFDVYSLSTGTALDGTKYSDW